MTASRRKNSLTRQRGQATVEYIVVAVGIVIAFALLSVGGQALCTNEMSGTLYSQDCQSLAGSVRAAMEKAVGEITFLINLPL